MFPFLFSTKYRVERGGLLNPSFRKWVEFRAASQMILNTI